MNCNVFNFLYFVWFFSNGCCSFPLFRVFIYFFIYCFHSLIYLVQAVTCWGTTLREWRRTLTRLPRYSGVTVMTPHTPRAATSMPTTTSWGRVANRTWTRRTPTTWRAARRGTLTPASMGGWCVSPTPLQMPRGPRTTPRYSVCCRVC